MAGSTFRALVLNQVEKRIEASIQNLESSALPAGDVTVRVRYSSLNYKDGLAITGKGKIIRNFPGIPGIDLAGEVVESASSAYKPGDQVILTGWGIGEMHWGGMSQCARVKSEWLVPLPAGMSLKQSMAIGTAGFTAMLSVMALEQYGIQKDREIVVTGSTGGVGSVAVAVLASLGYKVAASTGRPELHDYLRSLGATTMIDRAELANSSPRAMESERWGGAVDTVGGTTLASLIKSMALRTGIAVCGLVASADLNTTVYSFLLRGVGLLGIDSATCPLGLRTAAWQRLAKELPADVLEGMTSVKGLSEVPALAEAITLGQIRGRTVIDVDR